MKDLGLMASRPIHHAAACPNCEALRKEIAECRAAMHTISAEITRLVDRANELANENAVLTDYAIRSLGSVDPDLGKCAP